MEVVLGKFAWSDIVKYQDQDIELKFVADETKYPKPKSLEDYKEYAARKGRIMALPTHLPYIKEHYKSVVFDELAAKQVKEVCNVVVR